MNWIIDNYLVLISGVAVPAIYGIINFFKNNGKNITNIHTKGNKNKIITAGRDVCINKNKNI